MKLIRKILGVLILLYERLFSPKGIVRSAEIQKKIDEDCKTLKLYEFETCPFCVKVRMAVKKLALPIERRDVLKNKVFEEELIKGGGERQVPCLRIEEGTSVRWLYESNDIISYLEKKFQ